MRGPMMLALMVVTVAGVCGAQLLADPSTGTFFESLYSDHRASAIGDVVLVVISESALASHSATRSTQKSSSAQAGPGTGELSFIPLLGYSGQSKGAAQGQSQSRDLLTARVSAVVTGVTEAGNLIIEGERRVSANRDFQTIRIKGEVRPVDIGPDNTVLSQHVANAQIDYTGPDPGKPGGRVGFITRVLGWLF